MKLKKLFETFTPLVVRHPCLDDVEPFDREVRINNIPNTITDDQWAMLIQKTFGDDIHYFEDVELLRNHSPDDIHEDGDWPSIAININKEIIEYYNFVEEIEPEGNNDDFSEDE